MSEFLGLSPTICDYPSRPCDYGDTSIYPTDDLPMTTLPRSGCTPDDGLEFYADLEKGGRMIIFS